MTDDESVKAFGKRKAAEAADQESTPRKRSNKIALLLMGTMAFGGGAYALMPGETCDPNRPTIEQPGCRQSSSSSSGSHSSGSHYYGSSGSSSGDSAARSNFASTGSSSNGSYGSTSSSSSSVARSGFGSFASHFSGGG
jgi:hypothetical protein